jgi:hypothetical protein
MDLAMLLIFQLSLAHLELYASIATIFSRFEMDLFETTEADMEIIDKFAPVLKSPVKVRVIKDRWIDSDE